MEDIKTIFYFANNLDYLTYLDKLGSKEIANRTIVFSKNNRSIFAGGVQYSPMTLEEIKEIVQELLGDNGDLVLPAATKDVRGAIRVGEGLSMGEGDDYDVLNVDFSKVNNIDDLVQLIRRLFDSAESLRADKDNFGIVKLGDGLSIGSEGELNVDFADIPNNADVYADYDKYGVVKILRDGGITVTNGVISVDSSKFPDNMRGKDGQPGRDGQDGRDGKSAYEIAVENGFTGTVQEWLDSLKGADGQNGQDGADGQPGRDGVDGQPGRDGIDGINGADAVVDIEALKADIIDNIKGGITEENNWWYNWARDLLDQAQELLLDDLDGNWNTIMHEDGWKEAMYAYLTGVKVFNVSQDSEGISISERFAQLEVGLDLISETLRNIGGFFDENGNPVSLSEAIAQMISGINDNQTFNEIVASKVNEELQTGRIQSAIADINQLVSDIEDELTATNKLVTRVDNGNDITLNLLKQISDGTKAATSLSSSYDMYEMDGDDYRYATENGKWIYDIDEDGKAIPWKAIKLFYVDKDTGLPIDESVDSNRRRVKKNSVWKDTNDDGIKDSWVEEVALDEDGNIMYDMVGEVVYFAKNPSTGDLPRISQNYPSHVYIREKELDHDRYGNLIWTKSNNNLPISGTNPKMLSNPNIAYHRARVRKTISLADLQLGANADHAWNFLSAMYEGFGDVQNIASTTQIANANGAAIETMARHTCYIPKINGNGNVEKDQDGNILYQWEKVDENGNVIIDENGNATTEWSSFDNSPQLEGTWRRSLKQDVKAGMTAVATNYFALTEIKSVIDDVATYMRMCIEKDEQTGEYTSSAYIKSDKIVLDANNTFVTNLTANEAFINSLKTKDLGASHRLVVGEVGSTGIVVQPISGGYGTFNMGVLLNNDGVISTPGALVTNDSNNLSGLTITPQVGGAGGGVTILLRTEDKWVEMQGGTIKLYRGNDTGNSNLAFVISEGIGGYEITTYGMERSDNNTVTVNKRKYTKILPGSIQLSDGTSYRTIGVASGS